LERDVLVVVDGGGRELWRRVFPGINPDSYMHATMGIAPPVWFGDLAGDGTTQVLFRYASVSSETEAAILYCFDADGRERWRYRPGKLVRTREGPDRHLEAYAPPFGIEAFDVGALGPGGANAVVVSAAHHLWWPGQVTLLSRDGKVLCEYWHSGRLSRVAQGSLEGKPVVFLGGVSNARRAATLVVLDTEHWSGASVEENQDFQLLDMAAGVERRRFLFSRSCINRRFEQYNVVNVLSSHPDGLTVTTIERFVPGFLPTVYYTFDPAFRTVTLELSDVFQAQHRQLRLDRRLDHEWTESEAQALSRVEEVKGGRAVPFRAQ
jgi:hypothetical protein